MKISIAVVVYNAVTTIEETLLSIIQQDYCNMEIIVVDGLSNDGTIDIVKKYKNIKWISEQDNGIYDAMNKVLNIATGDFLLFLGADDHFISNNTISMAVKYMANTNNVYYGDVYRNGRNDLYRGKFNKYLLACENICHQSIFYPSIVYKKMKYDLQFPVYADYIYNLRNWNHCQFQYIPVCIAYYNTFGISGRDASLAEKYSSQVTNEIKKNLGTLCWGINIVYKLYKSFF